MASAPAPALSQGAMLLSALAKRNAGRAGCAVVRGGDSSAAKKGDEVCTPLPAAQLAQGLSAP